MGVPSFISSEGERITGMELGQEVAVVGIGRVYLGTPWGVYVYYAIPYSNRVP